MWTIYFKELLELARERKTFIFTILIPIVALPLIFGGFTYLSSTIFRNASQAELGYAIFGKQNAPQLAQRLAQEKGFKEVGLSDAADIRNANTREAYARAVARFLEWCEARGLDIQSIEPLHVAAYIEALTPSEKVMRK